MQPETSFVSDDTDGGALIATGTVGRPDNSGVLTVQGGKIDENGAPVTTCVVQAVHDSDGPWMCQTPAFVTLALAIMVGVLSMVCFRSQRDIRLLRKLTFLRKQIDKSGGRPYR